MNKKYKNSDRKSNFSKLSEPYQILYTPAEKEFDEITKLASIICDTPISLITFFDENNQFFKSHYGVEISETPIEDSFCRHVVNNSDELMIVSNTKQNELFKDNPWVKTEPGIIFYAGYPINNREGDPFAVLCVIDHKTKELSDNQKEALRSLSFQVEKLLELRRIKFDLETRNTAISLKNKTLENIIEGTDAGTWELEIQSGNIFLNDKWFEILGYSSETIEEFTLDKWKEMVYPDDLKLFEKGLSDCMSGDSEKLYLKYRIRNFQEEWIWVENRAKVINYSEDGEPTRMFGIHLNINKEKVQEKQFLTIADSIPGAVFRYEIDKNGTDKLAYVSNGFMDLWGIPSDEAIKDNLAIWDLVYKDDLPEVKKSIEHSASHMTNWDCEWRVKQPDGTTKWHKGIGRPTKEPNGSVYWDSLILDITEEKKNSEQLLERNEFIETILENLPIGIAVNDMVSGKATLINDRFSVIYGWPKEELLDVDTFFEKVFPGEMEGKEIKRRFNRDIQSGEDHRMDWKGKLIRRKNGEVKIIDAKNIPLYGQNLMISTVLDQTELYSSRNKLLDTNNRFKYATRATSDVIWDYDLVSGELHWGENYELNFGHKAHIDLTKNFSRWDKQIHPKDRQRVIDSIEKVINGSETNWTCEYRFQKKGGDYLEILDKGFVVRDSNGDGVRMVGAMQDITSRKQREHQLKIFESVLSNTADAIIITEAEPLDYPNGPTIVYVNEAFKKSTGYTEEEVLGKTPRILQGPSSDQNTLRQMGSDLRNWKEIDTDILNYTKEGKEFWVNLSIAPVANEKGLYTHWISIQKDITEKKNKLIFENVLNRISNVFNQQINLKDALIETSKILLDNYKSNVLEIWLVNSDKSKIYIMAHSETDLLYSGFSKEAFDYKGLDKGDGLPGVVWKKNGIEYWIDIDNNKEFIRHELAKTTGLTRAYGVPILYMGEVLGVIIQAGNDKIDFNTFNKENCLELGVMLGTELARKQLEVELNQLIAFAPGYICSLDHKGHFKQINPIFDTIIELNNRDLSQINFRDIVHPLDKSKVDIIMDSFERGVPIESLELRSHTFGNKTLWLSWNFSPVSDLGISYGVGMDISEKKELEQLLDKATELAKIGIWEVDLIEKEIYWSQVTKNIHEVPSDYEPNIETAIDFYKEERDKNMILDWIENVTKSHNILSHESQIITAKGKVKWIKSIGNPEIVNGKVIKIYGTIEDIDHRKVAELERILILESIGDGFFAVDRNWTVNYWNQKAESILGTPKSEILGKNLWEIYSDAIGSEFHQQYHLAIQENEPVHFEARYEPLDIWLDVSAFPSKESNGLTVYFKDVTTRKEALDQIKYSNERFLKIARATQDAIWDWDVLNKTLFWGIGFKERFGHEVIENNINLEKWSSLVHPKDRPSFFCKITDSLRDPKIEFFKNEYRLQKKSRKYAYVIDSVYIIRGDKGEPIRLVGAIQDITDRKLYEASLKKLNNKLASKAKLLESTNEELEQFAYVASHDLQEPLRMITSFLTLLEKKYSDTIDEKGKQYIYWAVDGAARMREIILELLDYSRVGRISEKLELVDIQSIIEEVTVLHKKQIQESGAQIITDKLPKIFGFKSPVRQIFLNLISNSIKYCDNDVTPKISISVSEEKKLWKFSVKDNGIGIDPAYYEKIFIIFKRLHARGEYSGTGMGLAITKKIVETLGGTIWVESKEGEGSTFTFTIKKFKK
ncbi:PAS domain-containing protein [Arenibacter sp. BSSL-BM3]|uniref:histidine kinase n=1 Tax=Arenibacter arenosicollis TaxID=2762274 RepID=A0ABR7QQX7_9FLAO|nr:PAS domain-containing protein [Arenibacter arenosicollis]MBC8769365.1 PAS domain-containing protein [Arenibacter arenosicollis]